MLTVTEAKTVAQTVTNTEWEKPGSVVQVTDALHEWYGSLWIVEEFRPWGVRCVSIVPGRPGFAVLNLLLHRYKVVGHDANWDFAKEKTTDE